MSIVTNKYCTLRVNVNQVNMIIFLDAKKLCVLSQSVFLRLTTLGERDIVMYDPIGEYITNIALLLYKSNKTLG